MIALIVIFVVSVIAHEVAHGYVAYLCGDPTAKLAGRLTFNPLAHIDPIRTLLVPAILFFTVGIIFGGAKPVPVNPYNYRNPKRDDILVSLAGVATNFALAIGLAILLRLLLATHTFSLESQGTRALEYGVFVNLLLGLFNLVPIPPLDGSHVLAQLLPPAAANTYRGLGETGFVLLLIVIFFTPLFRYMVYLIAWTSQVLLGYLPLFFGGG